jgi:hypothetical protein
MMARTCIFHRTRLFLVSFPEIVWPLSGLMMGVEELVMAEPLSGLMMGVEELVMAEDR